MTTKITIIATDFKPRVEGVKEYSFHLTDKLNCKGILDVVLTSNIQNTSCTFKVYAPHNFAWIKPFKEGFFKRKIHPMLYFNEDLYVLSDNNHAENNLRLVVTKRKVYGGSLSMQRLTHYRRFTDRYSNLYSSR